MAEIAAQVSSSIDALMQEFNIITHNLANVSTVGYKRRSNAFSLSLESQKAGGDTNSTGGTDLNLAFDFSQGGIVETGRPLDLALYGEGFFVIETPDGPLYTRNGVFHTNQTSQIVDSQGRTVAGETGPITIPTTVGLSQLNISSDGNITATGTIIGKLKLVDFTNNKDKLVSTGENCFMMPQEDIVPIAAENIVVKQGYQESSNVKMIDELVDMIMVSRMYEANMKALSATKDTSQTIIGVAMG